MINFHDYHHNHDYYHYLDQLIITIGLWDELDQKDQQSDQADHGGQDRPREQGGKKYSRH